MATHNKSKNERVLTKYTIYDDGTITVPKMDIEKTPTKIKKLWKEVDKLPHKLMSVQKLSKKIFEDYGHWTDMDAKRLRKANLSYPIIMTKDYIIIDGGHRFMKAYITGEIFIKVIIYDKDV